MKKKAKIIPLTADELTFFCTQLSLILKSGVTIRDGIFMLMEDSASPKAVRLLSDILRMVENKKPFYAALESTKMFSLYFVNMVKIGELTGQMDSVFDGLATYYQRESNLKNAVKGAIMHPLILLFMMSAVIAILILKVIPIFKDVFLQLGSQMSSASAAAIEFASTTGIVVLLIVGLFIIAILALFLLTKFKKGKPVFMAVASKITYLRRLFNRIAVSRFSSAMSLMMSSGVDTLDSLDLTRGVIDNKAVSEQIEKCSEKVKNHVPFSQAVIEVGLFPSLYSQMIRISYKSGSLDEVWKYISKKYDDDISDNLNNIVSFIEPLMVGILSVIIGVILIAVMLPLMGIMSSLG
ncbi:MAG: type II secretion system F family protein [Oscillospiraceae bacterium]|jgi:type IV pilus assembly protein PilC